MSEDTGKSKKVPKLRFPGFTDDWEQRRLGEIAIRIGDGLHGTPEYSDKGEVSFINGNNLIDGKILTTQETKKVLPNKQSRYDKELNENTILMSINGTIGSLAWYRNEKVMLGKSVAYIEISKLGKKFIYAYLQTCKVKSYFKNSLTGTTIKNLGLKSIRETPIYFGNIEEQQKIGQLFELLDHHITFQQRKLDHLKERKKALLQKMFPKEGTNVPEIRFPGFTDAWEQRRLGEVCEIIMGQSPSSNNYSSEPCGYILVQGNADIEDGWVTPRVWTTEITKIGKCNDIIMSVRAPAGSVGRTKYDVVLGRGVAAIKGNNFVYRQLEKMEFCRYWKRLASGSTFESLSTAHLKSATIAIPEGREQMMIGNFFELLDHYITVQQRKLDHLKLRKKALLQQMFV